MIRLQGSDSRRHNFDMLSRAQKGVLTGNAMTVSVVRALLVKVLQAIGMHG